MERRRSAFFSVWLKGRPLRSVGAELGLSHERVRQLLEQFKRKSCFRLWWPALRESVERSLKTLGFTSTDGIKHLLKNAGLSDSYVDPFSRRLIRSLHLVDYDGVLVKETTWNLLNNHFKPAVAEALRRLGLPTDRTAFIFEVWTSLVQHARRPVPGALVKQLLGPLLVTDTKEPERVVDVLGVDRASLWGARLRHRMRPVDLSEIARTVPEPVTPGQIERILVHLRDARKLPVSVGSRGAVHYRSILLLLAPAAGKHPRVLKREIELLRKEVSRKTDRFNIPWLVRKYRGRFPWLDLIAPTFLKDLLCFAPNFQRGRKHFVCVSDFVCRNRVTIQDMIHLILAEKGPLPSREIARELEDRFQTKIPYPSLNQVLRLDEKVHSIAIQGRRKIYALTERENYTREEPRCSELS